MKIVYCDGMALFLERADTFGVMTIPRPSTLDPKIMVQIPAVAVHYGQRAHVLTAGDPQVCAEVFAIMKKFMSTKDRTLYLNLDVVQAKVANDRRDAQEAQQQTAPTA